MKHIFIILSEKRVIHYSNYYIEFSPPLDTTPAVFGTQVKNIKSKLKHEYKLLMHF